jgi:hypothetical protein
MGGRMTFLSLQNRALEECGYAFAGASTPRTRFKARLNDVYRRILRMPGLYPLLRMSTSYTFASVAAQTTYGLPIAMGRIDALTEHDNDRRLDLRTLSWLRSTDPGLTASGTPTCYIPKGWFPVHTQPSDASAIAIKSTAAADTTQTAWIEYLTASGQRLTSSVTMNGTTAATLVASGAVEITALYVSAVGAGVISAYEDTGSGTILASIPIGSTAVKYLHIQLWPTPSAATTYYLDYTRELADLTQDTEDPILPADFHDLLWRGAVMDEWLYKDDSRAAYMQQVFDRDVHDLKSWVWNHTDYMPGPSPNRPHISRLGGWFEAGS